jgi:CBS domain containing-hemolysin-like protein
MLRNTFRLRELTARQVMVHRTRFISAPSEVTTAELLRLALREGYTRIPIYEDKIDNILGFVHIKDIFRLHMQNQESEGVQGILREVVFVPETMAILDVWDTLTRQNQYMAIVFDEYGSTAGLITMEDLVEEIFGELQDEFDDESALVALDKQGRIYLRGDLLVADVNEYLDLDLPVEAADTLSGLVFSQLGRPPRVGDQVELNGSTLRVEAVEDMGVREVSLKLKSTDMLHLGEWELADRE